MLTVLTVFPVTVFRRVSRGVVSERLCGLVAGGSMLVLACSAFPPHPLVPSVRVEGSGPELLEAVLRAASDPPRPERPHFQIPREPGGISL